jgi:hypothetical protein
VLVKAIHTAIERDFTLFVNTVLLFFACLDTTLEPAFTTMLILKPNAVYQQATKAAFVTPVTA